MRRVFRSLYRTLFFVFGLCFFSCTNGDNGIFWDIEHEVKVPDNSLSNTIGVYRIIRVPANPADDHIVTSAPMNWPEARYYLAGGSLFYRYVTPQSNWVRVPTPRTGSTNHVTDVVCLKTNSTTSPVEIYAAVAVDNHGKLFRLNEKPTKQIQDPNAPPPPAPPVLIDDVTSSYTNFDASPLYDGQQIITLIGIDKNKDTDKGPDEFFASTGTLTTTSSDDPNQFLRFWHDGSALQRETTGLTGEIMTAGTFDGANYWFVSRSHVFKIAGSVFPADIFSVSTESWEPYVMLTFAGGTWTGANPNGLATSYYFTDIFFDSGTKVLGSGITPPYTDRSNPERLQWTVSDPDLYVASKRGIHSTNAAAGAETHWDRLRDGWYTSLAEIEDLYSSNAILMCGTENSGLHELRLNDMRSDYIVRSPRGEYDDYAGLYYASINCLFVDHSASPLRNILIAGTTRSGAWNGDYGNIETPHWSHE